MLLVALGASTGSAVASSGSLDPSFGDGGVVSLPSAAGVSDIVERPDGSLVVSPAWFGDADALGAYLLAEDGTEMPESSGISVPALWEDETSDLGNMNTEGIGVAADGSFYLAGWASGWPIDPWRDLGPFSSVVGAFDADARPVAGFAEGGTFLGTERANFQVEAVRVQSDGKLLLAGARRGKRQALVLKRLTRDGQLDRSFSGDGSVALAARWRNMDGFVDLELMRGGKILAFGFRGGKILIARFKQNGALDRKFGKAGVATRKVARDRGCEIMTGCLDSDMTVSRDGSITAMSYGIGRTGTHVFEFPILHRLSASGRLKKTWRLPKAGGRKLKFATNLLQQRDGKLVLIGAVGKHARTVTAVVRIHKHGKPDRTFGENGIRVLPQIGEPGAAAITSDGKIVVAGVRKLAGPPSPLTVVRLKP